MEDSTVTRKKISKSKKREIDYLQQVQQAGLNSIVNIEVDTCGILAATAPHSKYFKHSLLPVILYEASRLLLKYPALNAYYYQEEIRFYNDVNVGVAIDIDEGLKTVSIRNTDALGMCELEDTLFSLSNKYVDRTLTPFDMADITFTVTDLSGEGILFFSPLINQHNSAILGMAAAKPNGAMVLTLTFDHRVTEGKAASGFLRELKQRMEDYRNRLGANSPDLHCSQCRKPLREDLSGFGFLKIVNKQGAESLLCQTCFKGL
jgi:pyruvate/2-oxoglutarate dehydrogenase complex dihydrolipoamide acyltransferase (E2) component